MEEGELGSVSGGGGGDYEFGTVDGEEAGFRGLGVVCWRP